MREDLKRIMGQTNNDCRFSDLHFDKFPTPATFACWKIRFKTEVCTLFHKLPTEAMLWIKEVGVGGISEWSQIFAFLSEELMDHIFEVLDAKNFFQHWTESSRIPASRKRSVWRKMKAQKEDRFLRGRQIRLLDLRVLPGHWSQWFLSRSMPTYLQLFFEMTIFQEIRFEMGRNFIIYDENPTWWYLGRIVQI